MTRETWLHGWPRRGAGVLLGTGVHCAGCGKLCGVTTAEYSADDQLPERDPDWPFDEADCPVCAQTTAVPCEDKLTARLLALRARKPG